MPVASAISRTRVVLLALMVLPALASLSCGGSTRARRYDRETLQEALRRLETPGLVMGDFRLQRNAVIDGDTIRVEGLTSSLRLLGIDAEETFKKDAEWRLYEQGWEVYLAARRRESRKPMKAPTPLGEVARKWAVHFFDGIDVVRLERDHPKEIRDQFGRYLAYVFVHKDGRWLNYNVECVRAGMSPYFMKYSYSRRFHRQLAQAQDEAQAALRGIWAPGAEAYPDYPERLAWWSARADFIQQFETDARTRSDHIALTHWDSIRLLEQHEGKTVVVLGGVGDIRLGDRGPTIVKLSRRAHADLPLVFFDKDVFLASRIARFRGEIVRVTGTVSRHRDPRSGRSELQIIVELPSQVMGPEAVPNYSGWPDPGRPQ